MFFIASKVIWFFLTPSNALAMLVIFGAVLSLTRFGRLARTSLVLGCLGLLIAGLSPLPNVLMLSLEDRFSVPTQVSDIKGIIVLGGATSAPVTTARGVMALNEAAERIAIVPKLAKAHPEASIILSGGAGQLLIETDAEAGQMADILREMGIEPSRIINEPNSRNTAENATETFRMIAPEAGGTYLLVTSAFHMPRAIGAFRAAGWGENMIAYPVDFRTRGNVDLTRPMASIGSGLKRTDTAVREWIGLVAYYLTDRTNSLFPGAENAS